MIRISSEKPSLPSGIFVSRMPTAWTDDRALEHELEAAGVLALVRVENEEAAAGEAAAVDLEADAVRWLEAERDVERAGVAGCERDVARRPMPVDEKLQRAELAGDSGADLELIVARRSPPGAATLIVTSSTRTGPSCRCGCSATSNAALPLKRMPCVPVHSTPSGTSIAVLSAEDLAQEAVALPRIEDDLEPLQLRSERARPRAAVERGREIQRCAANSSRDQGIAEQHRRLGVKSKPTPSPAEGGGVAGASGYRTAISFGRSAMPKSALLVPARIRIFTFG